MTTALAVTTRSHLRGTRFFLPMLIASVRIRRQLRRTDGCRRFASIVAGPREFWTVTVWETREQMLEFMRSGAHEDIMWLFGRWLDSFWLTRWRPTADEEGQWHGLTLAADPPEGPPAHEQRPPALDAALDALPTLKASVGPNGAPSYEYAPHVRRRRSQVEGGIGVTVRIETRHAWQAPNALRDLLRLRRRMIEHDGVLRWATGMTAPKEMFALAVLRDEPVAREFLGHPDHAVLRERWADGYWSMRWLPDNEFGHWDGLRLRSEKLGSPIYVPTDAAAAAGFAGKMPGPKPGP